MKINNLLIIATIVSCMASGCVSTTKYKDMQTARDHYKAEFENLKKLEKENAELDNKIRIAQNQIEKDKEDMASLSYDLENLKKENARLSARYEDAAEVNDKILTNYSTEKQVFEEKLATSEDELTRQNRQLQGVEYSLGMQSYNNETLRSDLVNREQRVAELERLLAEKEAQMAQLRLSLNDAMKGFSNEDFALSERGGNIYVTMSQKLLFKPGQDQVDASGQTALTQLAKALNDNPSIEIIVEGHTDNAGGVDYNWDLSTNRALSVVKILALNGVLPNRMAASGRGMHHPIVPNDSETNKAKNRRTEIILSPNLEKIKALSR